jgi:hypothetical protein
LALNLEGSSGEREQSFADTSPVPIDHLETHLADSQTILKISFQFMVSEIHHAAVKQGASYNYGMCDPRIWSFGPAAGRARGRSWDRPLALGPEMAASSLGLPPLRMRSTPVASPGMIDLVIAVERRGFASSTLQRDSR